MTTKYRYFSMLRVFLSAQEAQDKAFLPVPLAVFGRCHGIGQVVVTIQR
jgi:hypothetical protein